jgi:phospholipase C
MPLNSRNLRPGERVRTGRLQFISGVLTLVILSAFPHSSVRAQQTPGGVPTTTPIKYVVVIFQENISFDHYFATYPNAANPPNEPAFHARSDTPTGINNLARNGLLTQNPNSTPPFRLDRTQAVTCDQNHAYSAEQKAFDGGLMDKFPESVGYPQPANPPRPATCPEYGHGSGVVMGYYDGNTVTALWNYAQHFALSDNSFGSTFGPSTPGVLNLIAGDTSKARLISGDAHGIIANAAMSGALIGDGRPAGDDCNPQGAPQVEIDGRNVGDLLNAKNVTWGWFQAGFRRTSVMPGGKAVCGATSTGLPGLSFDYVAHHEGFQYFQTTQNLNHVPPSDAKQIGQPGDAANHQYDMEDFWTAIGEGKLPAVTFLKAKALQDGHAGYSDPLDEQFFLADTINRLERTPEWNNMAIIIAYDDSDGWYDHAMDPVVNQSSSSDDFLNGPGACGKGSAGGNITPGRCGYGPRLPLLVISPFAKQNFVDHTLTDQSSVLRFIEDNWNLGRIGGDSFDAKAGTLDNMFNFKTAAKVSKVFLDPSTGEVLP